MEFMDRYKTLFSRIESLLSVKARVTVAIDGGAAAGKTTLAALLAERYGGEIVHMDDFFLRPEQRTPERFAQAGGNFDRERFQEEVVPFMGKREPFSYRIFDCSQMRLFGAVTVPDCRLVIVEGSYSHHPAFAEAFDLRVFLRVDEEERKQRIIKRNGDKSRMFFDRWIPLENRYFEAFAIEKKADIVICG
ncbi:MAG: AAA family ATPase [Clostridia bacterium]|nr:AAA family ATPase [Clostridia bacterium]